MSLVLITIILGWQLVLVFTEKNPSPNEIRSLIKKIQEESDTVKESNVKLHSEISDMQSESTRKLSDHYIEKYNLSTEFTGEMDKLKMLHFNLSELYQEEQHFIRELNAAKASIQKLELGTKLLEDDIEQLETRRKKGHEDSCLKLLPTIREGKLRLRSVNTTEEDEIMVLTNELEHEKSKLNDATNRNEELKMVLRDKIQLSNTAMKNMESLIKEINGDLSKAKVRAKTLKEKCDKKKADILSLKESVDTNLNFVKDKQESITKLRETMLGFGKAILCYNKLEEEMLRKNF